MARLDDKARPAKQAAGSAPAAGAAHITFGVAFSHQGKGCTFETLCTVFGITEPAVTRIAQIVHDLDLKDRRFGAPDAGTVGTLIEGLQLTTAEDDLLLERGLTLFESLYRAFAHAARPPRPHRPSRPAVATAR